MKKFNYVAPILLGASLFVHANEEFQVDGVLVPTAQPNTQSCISYFPVMGVVKESEDLKINSDKFKFTDDKKLILHGNVELDFPEGLLRARNAELDRENGKIKFSNKGEIFLENFYFNSDEGFLNKDDRTISLLKGTAFSKERNLIFNFSELYGQLDEQIYFKNVSMSSCSNPGKGWVLEAREIVLNSEASRGLAKNIKIKASGATIFALPLLPFATSDQRMSGFLEPSISYSSDGPDLMIPYYKVISKTSDITMASRYIAKRGPGIEINYRSLHKETNNLRNLDLIYFTNDKEYEKELLVEESSRWIYKYTDELSFNSYTLNVNWAKSSDDLVLRDIPGDITSIGYQRIQNLNQSIAFQAKLKNSILTVEHQSYQSLNPIITDGYKKSPSVNFIFSKKINGFTIQENLNISSFKADKIHGYYGYQNLNNNYLRLIENPLEGKRIFSNFSISRNIHYKGFNLSSNIGLKSINFDLSNEKDEKVTSVNVPNALLDINSIFIKNKNNVRHLLEPRLTLGYTAYKDQANNPIFDSDQISLDNELYSNDRFSGMDRIGDQSFYTLSLGYKKISEGREKISLDVSKKYFLKDRKVWIGESVTNGMDSLQFINIDESPFILEGSWMPKKNTLVSMYAGYFNKSKTMPLGGLTIKHKSHFGSFGLAKRFRRMSGDFNYEMNYSEIFGDININSNFKIIAKLKRDDGIDKNIESLIGIEYENCCLALRISGSDRNLSRYILNQEILYPHLADAWDNMIQIESKGRINFEFELKGLNSSFNKANRFLSNSLFKY